MLFSAKDISVTLIGDDGMFHAVDSVSFDLSASEIIDITGPSGAGKSTLLHALGMQAVKWEGQMFLDGKPSTSFSPQVWRRRVALVQQKPILIEGTVLENLTLPWTLKVYDSQIAPSDSGLIDALTSAHLSDITLDRSVDRLSVGQQARVAVLRTLLTNPDVLLLDEADAALDAESAEAIGEMTTAFVDQGKGAIRVRHRADDGRAGMRIIMEAGRITSG
jgi:putative ABC transport system ATP-binding protein